MVFCEFPSPGLDIELAKKFAKEMHKDFPNLTLHFNYAASFKWHKFPVVKFSALAEMGYKLMHVSAVGFRSTMKSLWDCAVDLKEREEQAEIDFEKGLIGHPMEDYHKFGGFPNIKELEKKYLPNEEVRKKYEETLGYGRDEKT